MPGLLAEEIGGEIFPVHRLDRETGGCMVFAKTKAAAGKLSAIVSDRSMEKEYLAVIQGQMEEESAVLKDLLFRDAAKNKSFVVERQRKGVREAELSYRVLETKEKLVQLLENHGEMAFTVRIGPETGIPELEDCSLVTATYHLSDNTHGTIGVIGPTRMQYGRVLSILNAMGQQLSDLLNYKTKIKRQQKKLEAQKEAVLAE